MNNLEILFEDNYLLVLNKPSGLMVEEDRFNNPSLAAFTFNYLQSTSKKEIFIGNPHRIDRPTSGVLIFAKKKSSLKNLNEQFHNRTVKKTYLAITNTAPLLKEGKLVNFLFKDQQNQKALIFDKEQKDAQRVELHYKIKSVSNGYYLWEINLITGKYHQIRAQLAHIGCPIVGDKKYGSPTNYAQDKICLHAYSLELQHPFDQKPLVFIAPLPNKEPYSLFK